MSYINLLPDGGRSATRIPDPRPRVPTPKRIVPIFRQPDGGLYPGGQFPKAKPVVVAKPKAKTRTTIKVGTPKLSFPSASGSSLPSISLPGSGQSGAAIASIYRRTQGQLKQMAREAVLSETRPQVRALDVTKQNEVRNYNTLIGNLTKQLGLSKGDIKNLYDSLDVSLALNAKKQNQINTATKASLGTIYDTLTSQIGSNYQTAQNSTSSELKRMGIANPQANDRLTADAALLQGISKSGKANAQSLVDAINASGQGLMTGLRGGNQATGSLIQGQLQQQFDKSKGDALQTHMANLQKIVEQRNALISSEPSKINQTYAALLDQQYQREMDAAQKLFDNQIKLGNFNLAQQSATSAAQARRDQLALDAQRIAISAQKAAAPKASPTLKGPDKALDYIRQISAKSKVPYSSLETALVDAIDGNRDPNHTVPAFEKGRQSTYASDLQNALADRGVPSLYNDMIRAMQYWFGA